MQTVRHSVKENVLSDPRLVADKDYENYITVRGKGWVCEADDEIVGFAIADLKQNNIWALFVKPDYEKSGIGRKLHEMMLDWYFIHTHKTVWLSTAPNSRAEAFYRTAGWREVGVHGKGEIKFEMSFNEWKTSSLNRPAQLPD